MKKKKNVEHEVHAYNNIIRYNITSNNIVFVQRTRRFRTGARYARCDDIVLRRVTLFFFFITLVHNFPHSVFVRSVNNANSARFFLLIYL